MHSTISILRYLALTLGVVAGVGFCGAALVAGSAAYVPATSGEREVGPVIQAWHDRVKDEKAHAEKLRAAEAAELAQTKARMAARTIPVVARGDDGDGVTRPQRAVATLPAKLRASLREIAPSRGTVDYPALAQATQTATPWRERPSF